MIKLPLKLFQKDFRFMSSVGNLHFFYFGEVKKNHTHQNFFDGYDLINFENLHIFTYSYTP
jgi:hypothetical protein